MNEFEPYQEDLGGLTQEQLYANFNPEQLRAEKQRLLGRMAMDEAGVHILNRQMGIKDSNEGGEWIG